jgi:hypothetical protein
MTPTSRSWESPLRRRFPSAGAPARFDTVAMVWTV